MTRSREEEALEQWETQLRKGLLGLAVLAALWRSRLYGLELLKRLEGSALVVSEGTIYPLLNRLRAEGLVVAEWVESSAGPPRKYYALTPLGRSRVRAMAQAWERCSTALDGLLKLTAEEA